MKTSNLIVALLFLTVLGTHAQLATTTANTNSSTITTGASYRVVNSGAHYRIWQMESAEMMQSGSLSAPVRKYIELATGLNFWQNGQWTASKEKIEIAADGNSASATQGQHQAYFPSDIYQGAIGLVTPDGKVLQSQPIGLGYDDGNNAVMFAVLTNSTGLVLASGNQIIYANAFTTCAADLLYSYTKAGFEQDILIKEEPPTPESLGLNPATTRLQVYTEFFNAPQPAVTATTLPDQAGIALADQTLDFGMMKMVPGRAFLIGNDLDSGTANAQMGKQWVQVGNRQILVEEVPVEAVAAALGTLPLPQISRITSSNSVHSQAAIKFRLPAQHLATVASKKPIMQASRSKHAMRGLLLDYQILNSSATNYTFQGDSTYYISGSLILSGTNTFEGGAVLKYNTNASLSVSAINWLAAPYRPVIFTGKDDNSVGDTISGSTGNPTNYYANPALSISTPGQTLTCFRIACARQGVSTPSSSSSFYNGQFVNCQNGLTASSATNLLRNILFANVKTNFNNLTSSMIDVQNGTFGNSFYFATVNAGVSLLVTNSILSSVTNLYTGSPATFTGGWNGFYRSPAFGANQTTNTTFPFKTVGAGNYYLTNGCKFTNAGTAYIDAALWSGLQQKTTLSPLVYSNVTISINTNFTPQAQRDTNSSPNLGYHYEPIDYLADLCTITNAVLTVTNGAIIASYNEAGVRLHNKSTIVSLGSPVNPNWFVRYSAVQEQPISIKGSPSGGIDVTPSYSSAMPSGQFRFTKFACPANGGVHLYDYVGSSYSNLVVQDSEFWSGTNTLGGTNGAVITFKNNLFARSIINASGNGVLYFSNNLAWGVPAVTLNRTGTNVWYVFNNDFDSCSLTTTNLTNGNNAFLNCNGRIYPTNANDVVSAAKLLYQTGPLGSFYQPAGGALINAGNTNANKLGFYHYTTQTNQVKETNSIIDIGYHCLAAGANGLPLDSNGDGIPDYLQDANGNGIVDNGEINWGLAIQTQPTNQTMIQGSNVTFVVTAVGVAPLSYQWYFNTNTPLANATNATLVLSNVQNTNAGSYSVIVTNFTGSMTSSSAILTVLIPPSITSQPTNQAVRQGSNAMFSVTATGMAPLNYQWWFNATNKIAAATNATLAITNVQPTNTGNYMAVVTNAVGSVTSSNAILTMLSPVSITIQPQSLTVTQAQNATFSVTAAGTAPLVYQWYFNTDTQLANATNATLTLSNVQTNNAGTYTAVITNVCGSVTSSNAILTVLVPPAIILQPTNQTVPAGTNVTFSVLATGTAPIRYQWQLNGTNIGNATNLNYVLTNVRATNAGEYSVLVTNFAGNVISSNAVLVVQEPPSITIQPTNQTVILYSNVSFSVAASGTAPLRYQWYVGNTTNSGIIFGATNAMLTYTSVEAANANSYFVVVTNNWGTAISSNATLMVLVPPAITVQPANQLVAVGSNVTLSVTVAGTSPLSYQWYGVNSGLQTGATNNTLMFANVQTNRADNYYVTVTNGFGSTTSLVAALTVAIPPTITTQPTNKVLIVGNSVSFNITATGSAPLSYQWYGVNSGLVTNATNSSLTFTSAQTNNSDCYYAIVTNIIGIVASSNALLSVVVPLTIEITNPSYNAVFFFCPTNLAIEASVGDTNSHVQFYQGTNYLGTVTNPPYRIIWSNVLDGNYALNAVAINNGEYLTSAVVNISIFSTNNMKLWLKADSILGLTNNDKVVSWIDQSGNNNNATTNTINNGLPPLFVTNAINGYPAVQFYGAAGYGNMNGGTSLLLTNFPLTLTQAEAFVVLKVIQYSDNNTHPLWNLGASSDFGGYPFQDSWGGVYIKDSFGSASANAPYNLGFPSQQLTQFHVYEVVSQTNNWQAWINGRLQYQTSTNSFGISSEGYLGIGGDNWNHFSGSIAEVLIFNRALVDNERVAINAYLNGKYGLVSTMPDAPSNLLARAVSTTQIGLTWDAALNGGATQISIERSTESNGVFSVVAQISSSASYFDTNLTAGTTYYYRVRAINIGQWSAYSGIATATTLATGDDVPLGSLVLWLKADVGLVQSATNTPVNFWKDQSGKGNNAVQPIAGKQPVWMPAVQGNRPAVYFNGAPNFSSGSNSILNMPNFPSGMNQGEAFVVLEANSSAPGNNQPLWYMGAYNYTAVGGYPCGGYLNGHLVDDFGMDSSISPHDLGVPSQPLTQFHVYEVVSQTNNWQAWINGELQYQTNYNIVKFPPESEYHLATLGGAYYYFGGYISEVLIFNRALTTGERVTVNDYLNGKYFSVPPTPTNLTAMAISQTQIRLDWSSLSGMNNLSSLERAATSNGIYSVVLQTNNTFTYIDSNLTNGTTYYYRVRLLNSQYSTPYSSYSCIAQATTLTNGLLPFAPVLWLKANIGIVTNSSGQVNIWMDQSGMSNNVTQAVSNNQPAWLMTVANSNPVVRFNGTNSYFNLPNFMSGVTGAEAFVVLKAATNQPSGLRSLWGMGGDTWIQKYYPNTDGSIRDDFGSSKTKTLGIPTQPINQFHVYEVSSQTNDWSAWINGILQYQTTNNSVSFPAELTLGAAPYEDYGAYWFGATSYFAGDIAEILVFNRRLTHGERSAVNAYLNGKHALVPAVPATPSNLFARAISPTQIALTWDELLNGGATQIGIGRSSSSNGTYEIVAQIPGATSYIDTNLMPGTTYFYQVQAINLTEWSPTSNVAQATTPIVGTNLPFGSLALWLKADAGLWQSGSNNLVNLWADQSGKGNNAYQTANINHPLWMAGVAGGRPTIHFNGTNSFFSLPNFLDGATGAEAYVVLKVTTNQFGNVNSLWEMGGDNWNIKAYPAADGSLQDDFGSAGGYANNGVHRFMTAQPLNQYHIYGVSSQPNDWNAWINGVRQFHSSKNTVSFTAPFNLGMAAYEEYGMGWYTYTGCFSGDIAEILVFNRKLTTAERKTINIYLNGKYKLVPEVPNTPSNLVATAVSPTQVSLTWNEVLNGGATQISIERMDTTGWAYQVIGEVSSSTAFLDTNALPGTTYYYRVRAININQWTSYSFTAQATTPIDGMSVPLNSLALWLKADAGVWLNSNSTPVSFWADQSGGENNAGQLTAPYQPVWVPGTNGQPPTMFFNGTNNYFTFSSFMSNASGAEAFVVLSVSYTNSFHSLWEFGGYSWLDRKTYPDTDGSVSDDFASSSVHFMGVPTQPLNQFHVYEVSSKPDDWQAWINGALLYRTSESGFNAVSYAAGISLGKTIYAIDDPGAPFIYYDNSFFAGNIAEVLVFNRSLDDSERAGVNRYLKCKYGLSPVVSIVSPANNTVLTGSTNIFISATNNLVISQIEFYQGEISLGGVTNSPCSMVWSNVPFGSYALTARATDNNGIIYTSSIVNVTVAGITIITPTNNVVLSAPANLPINAMVVDGAGITQVQFLQGTYILGSVSNAPFSLVWSNAPSGSYALTAQAADNNGIILTSSVVNVIIDSMPNVTLTNPLNNARFVAGTNISLLATASDSDGTITQIQYFQGTNSLGIMTNSPFSLVWSNVSSGSYALTAQATDNNGLIATSAVVNISVAGISISSPANNTVLTAPATISINAVAVDNSTVNVVQYFQGTTSLGFATNAPYSLVWSNVAAGTYGLTASATDSSGLSITSSQVNVIVDTDPNSTDRDGDGMADYLEYLEGRNPLVGGAVPDVNGVVNLQVYTPIH